MHKRILSIIIAVLIVAVAAGTTVALLHHKSSSNTATTPSTPDVVASDPSADGLKCVETLPANIKISQKLMVAGYSDLLATETPVFVATTIGGVIIMDQTPASAIKTIHDGVAITPSIAVDQEGGTVQRYTQEGVLPGAKDMATNYTTAQAYNLYLKDDTFLKTIGITTNFAPIVDVESQTHSPLPGRIYSSDPNTVVSYATQAIKASTQSDITPVIKHFPGLGSATGNTDFTTATTAPLSELQTRDLIPYTKLSALKPDVMVSNAIVPGLTDGNPAVWSPAALALLRSSGYQQSVVYTDSLTAAAIPGTLADASVKSWQAGIDVALIVQTRQNTPNLQNDLTAIIARATSALQSGELNSKELNASVARILARKGINPCDITI